MWLISKMAMNPGRNQDERSLMERLCVFVDVVVVFQDLALRFRGIVETLITIALFVKFSVVEHPRLFGFGVSLADPTINVAKLDLLVDGHNVKFLEELNPFADLAVDLVKALKIVFHGAILGWGVVVFV